MLLMLSVLLLDSAQLLPVWSDFEMLQTECEVLLLYAPPAGLTAHNHLV